MIGLPWDERVDATDLGWARIGVGIAALAEGVYVTLLFDKATRPGVLRVPVTEWLPAPSALLVLLVGGVWLVAAGAFTLGFRTRRTGTVLAATMALTMALDLQFYSYHLYLLMLLVALLTAANAGAYRSLEAREDGVAVASPVWAVFLLRAQVSIVYAFVALSTVKAVYSAEPGLAPSLRPAGTFLVGEGEHAPELLAAALVLVAWWLAGALWSPRRRRAATLIGLAFHAILAGVLADLAPVGIFGVAMISAHASFYVPLPMSARGVRRSEPAYEGTG